MEIKVDINRTDLVRMHLKATLTIKNIIILFFINVALSSITQSGTDNFMTFYWLLDVLIISIALYPIFILFIIFYSSAFTLLNRKMKGVLGEHIVTISEYGLQEKTDVNETFYNWQGIDSLTNNGKFIFIGIAGNTQYFILPSRAFPSKNEFINYWDKAHSFWDKAKKNKKVEGLIQVI